MDGSPTGLPNIVYSSNNFFSRVKLIPLLLLITFLVVYTLIIFYLSNLYFTDNQKEISKVTSQTTRKMVSEDSLPFGLPVLQNPLVYQWRGSVEGELTKKDEASITLTKNGKTIIIPVDSKLTPFFIIPEDKKAKEMKSATIVDIPIGVYLRGEFFTTPKPTDKNSIFGSMFEVTTKAP